MDELLTAKLISGLTLFLVSLVCGVIPFKLAKILKWTETTESNGEKKENVTVNVLLSFGGGVLLATTFLHLLPDINFTIAYLKKENLIPEFGFGLGEFLMMIGFFMIYLIEELVHNYLHRHQNKLKKTVTNEKHDLITSDELNDISLPHKVQENHTHSHHPIPGDDALVSSLRGLLIVLALSIHELFEGFAVGLLSNSTGVYFMFAAVSAHKFVIAFCVGVELMIQGTKTWLAFVYVLTYSAVSAIGIAVGALLTSGSNADNLQVTNAVLQGLATGTLLYVIYFEVLSKNRTGFLTYLSVFGGFLIMFGLQYIAGVSEIKGLRVDTTTQSSI